MVFITFCIEFFAFRIGVEPLYPQVCQKVPVLVPTKEDQGPSPVDLSRLLNTISCSLSIKREDPIAIFHLILEVNSNFLKILKYKSDITEHFQFVFLGSTLHARLVELRSILVVLFTNNIIFASFIELSHVSATFLRWASYVVVLLDCPTISNFTGWHSN